MLKIHILVSLLFSNRKMFMNPCNSDTRYFFMDYHVYLDSFWVELGSFCVPLGSFWVNQRTVEFTISGL